MKIIIISGKSDSGKDTLANFMKEELELENKRVLIIHYGDAVKWVLRDYFNWNGQKDEHGRTLLQHIGTDVVRAKYPNFWVSIVAGLISAFEHEFDIALIPDARFPNEIEVIEETIPNVTLVRIERTIEGQPWINPLFTKEQLKHPSEISLNEYGFDYIVLNESGLDELQDAAWALLNDLKLIKGE